jgi:hypothetical protein
MAKRTYDFSRAFALKRNRKPTTRIRRKRALVAYRQDIVDENKRYIAARLAEARAWRIRNADWLAPTMRHGGNNGLTSS